ncbi:MAG: hypothetical protein GY765_07525 [bacterium]|nr:hypothetical protein [bacterium]
MRNTLPRNPLEVFRISGALRFAVNTMNKCADIFKFWKQPSLKAAGDFENMGLMDKFYWSYKSIRPIVVPENGNPIADIIKNNTPPQLPKGFEISHKVTISAVGDLIKVDGLENSRDKLYEHVVEDIFRKDISIANLESQLGPDDAADYVFTSKEPPPLFCTPKQYEALKGHKVKQFSVLNTACNHTFDMGLEGLERTLQQLEKDKIKDLGTNRRSSEKKNGKVIELNGIRIGFVSATFGLNGKVVPKGKEHMVNVVKFHKKGEDESFTPALLKEQIHFCKQKHCHIIIASLHWGYEYECFPRSRQIETAHAIIEAGVDVIISHHPHILQPLEFYTPKRAPKKTAVIAYSLGNLTSSFSAPYLVLSGILNLTIFKGTDKGREMILIGDVKLIPVVQLEKENEGNRYFQLKKLSKLKAASGDQEEEDYISAIKSYADLALHGPRVSSPTPGT